VAGTVTAGLNQQNSSETNLCCISAAWFILVSLLLPVCDIVCVHFE
jgi:hypothetical protein